MAILGSGVPQVGKKQKAKKELGRGLALSGFVAKPPKRRSGGAPLGTGQLPLGIPIPKFHRGKGEKSPLSVGFYSLQTCLDMFNHNVPLPTKLACG